MGGGSLLLLWRQEKPGGGGVVERGEGRPTTWDTPTPKKTKKGALDFYPLAKIRYSRMLINCDVSY